MDDDLIIDDDGYRTRLGTIQQGIYFNYDCGKGKDRSSRLIQNLNTDMLNGYMYDDKSPNGGSYNSDHNMRGGWNNAAWICTYFYIFPQVYQSENATQNTHSALFGVTKIPKVEVTHRVTDHYGPITCKNLVNTEKHYRPDKQEDACYEFFSEFNSAVAALTRCIEEKSESNGFVCFDILLDGKHVSRVKLVNSLRLRLAMRITSAAPDKACAEIQKVRKNNHGSFKAETGGAIVSTKSGCTSSLEELNHVRDETYTSANMESILAGHNDPCFGVYFKHCTDEALRGQYRGIRQGTCFAHSRYSGLSELFALRSTDVPLMTASEVRFLRVRIASRGWTDEDKETCYRNDVTTSFHQWGTYGAEDHSKSELTASDSIDIHGEESNIEACRKVIPKWSPQGDKETKMEKIITWKWIAMFLGGRKAWTEQRRTGYPRLFPVWFSYSRNGCTDTETMVRRLNFSGTLQTGAPKQYPVLTGVLGGDDHGGTRLWRDTGNNNLE